MHAELACLNGHYRSSTLLDPELPAAVRVGIGYPSIMTALALLRVQRGARQAVLALENRARPSTFG